MSSHSPRLQHPPFPGYKFPSPQMLRRALMGSLMLAMFSRHLVP